MRTGFRCLSALLTLSAAGLPGAARADWTPHRPLEVVVPSAPGGGLDLVGRTLQSVVTQEHLSTEPMVVLNRPGGGGTVGLAYLNAHPGNGHYVSVQALPLVTNRLTGLSPTGPADVTPLAVFLTEPVVFSVSAESPIKSGRDLAAALRRDPTSVSMAVSSSPGGQSHDAAALVLKAIGVDPKKLKIVFFDSGGEAVTALMGNHVTVAATPAGVVLGPSQAGRIRLIGIPAETRATGALAGVPTWKEQGVDAVFATWRVLVGPKGMTPDEIAWWDALLQKATASPIWTAALARNLWTADYKDSADTKAFLSDETARLEPLLKDLGLAQ